MAIRYMKKCSTNAKSQRNSSSHLLGFTLSKRQKIINGGKNMKKSKPLCTIGRNVNWYSHYGEECGDSLKNWKKNGHMTQQSHCWTYKPRKPELKEARVPQCSLQHCLQWPGHGSNLDVHWQTNG